LWNLVHLVLIQKNKSCCQTPHKKMVNKKKRIVATVTDYSVLPDHPMLMRYYDIPYVRVKMYSERKCTDITLLMAIMLRALHYNVLLFLSHTENLFVEFMKKLFLVINLHVKQNELFSKRWSTYFLWRSIIKFH
jgi:hypothetical protein